MNLKEVYNREKIFNILEDLKPENKRNLIGILRVLSKMANQDFLIETVYNKRKFIGDLKSAIDSEDKAEKKRGLHLLFLDIDGMGLYNKKHGHQATDKMLKEMGDVFRWYESKGLIYRYGGDEFAVILRNTSLEGAVNAGERFRRTIEDNFKDKHGITVSVGVSDINYCKGDVKEKADQIVEQADEAVYASKEAGKNKVTLYTLPRDLESVAKSYLKK